MNLAQRQVEAAAAQYRRYSEHLGRHACTSSQNQKASLQTAKAKHAAALRAAIAALCAAHSLPTDLPMAAHMDYDPSDWSIDNMPTVLPWAPSGFHVSPAVEAEQRYLRAAEEMNKVMREADHAIAFYRHYIKVRSRGGQVHVAHACPALPACARAQWSWPCCLQGHTANTFAEPWTC